MKISILGCGWLGFPLAKSLIDQGFSVKGSTTSDNKITTLENARIDSYLLSVEENEVVGNIASFLETSEVLILNIPPKLGGNNPENFIAKMTTLLPFIEKSIIKKVIFISSTSVYADDNSVVTENTIPKPNTESGRQLLTCENLLLSNTSFQTTIVRFGGLIGEDRHPIRMLSGRKNIENPDAPINLIHQKDCIGIVEAIIKKEIYSIIFNAVTPLHPTRKDYYTQKAIERNLPLPEFENSKPSVGKLILIDKVISVLGYSFVESLL